MTLSRAKTEIPSTPVMFRYFSFPFSVEMAARRWLGEGRGDVPEVGVCVGHGGCDSMAWT